MRHSSHSNVCFPLFYRAADGAASFRDGSRSRLQDAFLDDSRADWQFYQFLGRHDDCIVTGIWGGSMSNSERKTCAHIPCRCLVEAGQKYCGQICEDAGSEDVEIACECDHPPDCALTVEEESVA